MAAGMARDMAGDNEVDLLRLRRRPARNDLMPTPDPARSAAVASTVESQEPSTRRGSRAFSNQFRLIRSPSETPTLRSTGHVAGRRTLGVTDHTADVGERPSRDRDRPVHRDRLLRGDLVASGDGDPGEPARRSGRHTANSVNWGRSRERTLTSRVVAPSSCFSATTSPNRWAAATTSPRA